MVTSTELLAPESRIKGAIALKDYAVKRGLTIPEDVLRHVNEAQQSLISERKSNKTELGVKIDKAINELTKLTYPTTVESVIPSPTASRAVTRFKYSVPVIAVAAALTAVVAYASSQPNSRYASSFLAMSLGLLGALSYQMFGILGVLQEKAFTVEDIYANILRLILGLVMGWIFYFSFARTAFQNMGSTAVVENPGQQSSVLLLLLPFLVGFSTKLVVGIMQQLIKSVMMVFGIEDKSTEIQIRRRRNEALSSSSSSIKDLSN